MKKFQRNIIVLSRYQLIAYAVIGDGIIRTYLGRKQLDRLLTTKSRMKCESNAYMQQFSKRMGINLNHYKQCSDVIMNFDEVGARSSGTYFEAVIGFNFINSGVNSVFKFLDYNQYIDINLINW